MLYAETTSYGIILTSGNTTMYWSYSINSTKLLKTIKTDLPNKHKTGGQSAQRFERIRDEKISLYVKKICEIAVQLYCENGLAVTSGLYVAGNAEIKHMVVSSSIFQQYFNGKILGVYTLNEIQPNSIYQIIDKISLINIESCADKIDKLISDITTCDYVVIGYKCKNMLNNFMVRELYVTQECLDTLDPLIVNKIKTTIVNANDKLFIEKYGNIVGLTYYNYDDYDDNDE